MTMEPVDPRDAAARSWTREPPRDWPGDARALARDLARELEGEVGFDRGSRALYSTDASNYRQVPIGVVWPRTVEDVVRAVAISRAHDAPILSRGGGTSLAGQCCNVAVVIDWSRHMRQVLAVDPEHRVARVRPGCVLDELRSAAEEHGLTFGPDPATHNHCTLGGMLGNNSCGVHSIMAGRTSDNVRTLEVLTYDGERMTVGETPERELQRILAEGGRRAEIYRGLATLASTYGDRIREAFPDIPRRVSGYNLGDLLPENGFHVARALVGSEGTCVTILEAELDLVASPPCRALLTVEFDDVYVVGDHVPELMALGPIGFEAIDHRLLEYQRLKGLNTEDLRLLPDKEGGWAILEFGADSREQAEARARDAWKRMGEISGVRNHELFTDPEDQERIWKIRESGLGATARVPDQPDAWPGWEDSAVPPEAMGGYLRDLRGLLEERGLEGAFYGHFGQGCLHSRITFDLLTAKGLATYHDFARRATELCASYGGSISGEHGDGQARAELLPVLFGEDVAAAFREFKALWDPRNRMNPGKVCDPYPILSNLRLGTAYAPREPATVFRFPGDDFQLSRALTRCVGVGECRRFEGGTMCPSYRVTGEERHSTRGRARLLFEMLRGEVVTDGWASREVAEALDLCLACKGCRTDCPVNVDMATYKAEFLYHHYKTRRRPRVAYAMGLIHWWARLAATAPRLVNTAAHAPGLSRLLKAVGGIAPQRDVPSFAARTFRRSFQDRPRPDGRRKTVVLFPDTFVNHFHPEIATDAVDALERLGYRVEIPEAILCCGRPLYDYGFLPLARRLLRRAVDALAHAARRGTPVVGLEPSCVAAFRDELANLLPHDRDAERLRRVFVTLGELLGADGEELELPRLEAKALLHGHCHHKAVMGLDAEADLLRKLGLDLEVLDSGCCGMAGSFGFERDKLEISLACGERVLLPAARAAAEDTLIVADGFSCREQIRQTTRRRALHTAQVLRRAFDQEEA